MRDKTTLFATGVAVLFLAAIIREIAIDRMERALAEEQRHHVFCDLLREGMTRAEVHEILSQFGPFEEHQSGSTLRIVYTDAKTKHQFTDGVLLYFRRDGDRYMGASSWVPLGDEAPLCRESR
jgi:hypothetical protein